MKKIPCSNPVCENRRPHHESEEDTRPHRMVEVPDDYTGKSFCSLSCAILAGYYSVKDGWIIDPATDVRKIKKCD